MADGQPTTQGGGARGKANPILFASTAVFFLLTIILFALWTQARNRPPQIVEKIKEVPVEKVKEVSVDRTKEVEVPAKLTDEQRRLLDYGTKVWNRPLITDPDAVLYTIPAFKVGVYVDDRIKDTVSDERVRNKFELTLRKSHINIDSTAVVDLWVVVDAKWDDNKTFAIYTVQLKASDRAMLERNGDMRDAKVTFYHQYFYGYAGKTKVAENVLDAVDQLAEEFANKYLAVQAAEQKMAAQSK